MGLPGLLCLAVLAASSFSKAQEEEITPVVSIAYKVLEVFPKGRRVLITCHAPQAPLPITYSLCGTKNIEVAKKVLKTHEPASFNLNITLKSSPDLLTYFCQAATTSGAHVDSARLQMYWELWSMGIVNLAGVRESQDVRVRTRTGCRLQGHSQSPGAFSQDLLSLAGALRAQFPGRGLRAQKERARWMAEMTEPQLSSRTSNNSGNLLGGSYGLCHQGHDQKMEDWQGPLEHPILALLPYRSTDHLSEEELGVFRTGNGEVRRCKAAAM
ncbi:hypothetical protein EGM_08218 [Macaca fascicularis]|uniref:IL-40-like Ig domain-containing protein n=1 Tax=Macaca fascicularis TaxID=9541 RepID=G7PSX4_MACFA|nr:hypothetical protein EGM_08218 [Macaca fascicularis]